MSIFIFTVAHRFSKFITSLPIFVSSPTPQVEWIKIAHRLPENAQVENYGKLLLVSKVKQEDSGKYMCKAKNGFGEAVHYFTVTVEGKRFSQSHNGVLIKCWSEL